MARYWSTGYEVKWEMSDYGTWIVQECSNERYMGNPALDRLVEQLLQKRKKNVTATFDNLS
jgi:hypothetical protein